MFTLFSGGPTLHDLQSTSWSLRTLYYFTTQIRFNLEVQTFQVYGGIHSARKGRVALERLISVASCA